MRVADIVVACIGGITLLGIYGWIGIAFYLARTKAQEYAGHFGNSPFIRMKVTSRKDSFTLQLWYIGAIGSCVTFPVGHIKRGELSEDDLRRLPNSVKRMFLVLHCTLIGLVATLMLTFLIGKFGFDL